MTSTGMTSRTTEYNAALVFACYFLQKLHERFAVLARADGLLRHFRAGRVGGGSDLEQLRHRLRRPGNVELLQRRGKIVTGQSRNPAPEDAGERRAGAVAFIGTERVTGDAAAEDLRAMITGISGE